MTVKWTARLQWSPLCWLQTDKSASSYPHSHTHTTTGRLTYSNWPRKGLLFEAGRGYCSWCHGVGTVQRFARGKLYLETSLQDPVCSSSLYFGQLGTVCSQHRDKVKACCRKPRGESLLCSHLLPSSPVPLPTVRPLQFKPSHVLAITLPQWPCWAQHLESHKNIIVQLLGSIFEVRH